MPNTLIKKKAVYLYEKEKEVQLTTTSTLVQEPTLTDEQSKAIEQIQKSTNSTFLLHGVTGSGKTEIFLQLAKEVLSQGKQVLFLVPEIGLTPLMISRVTARFKERVAIYHSGLNATEKYNQYCAVRDHKVQIVIGTRSAVFMPFDQLGLILMDEEHDSSYKQDSMPRYHTRDLVRYRAHYHNCKVVLASATPSLESYARAQKNQYELVTLTKRVSVSMPSIHLIDMKKEKSTFQLSNTLIEQMQMRLENNEQIILLLNRRGYLPMVKCMDCNTVLSCPDCGLALTYHRKEDYLLCHCCGRSFAFNHTCPSCGSKHFYQSYVGTEKLQEQVQSLFPNAHIVRMDADTTMRKNSHEKLLKEFEEKGDILLGTQMIAKGLDFPRVTLVGILNADASLSHLEYASNENAYQLLEQASGRSGRSVKQGQVYIQTFDPEQYVMQDVVSHDYLSFYKQEMQFRALGQYPPYVFLCSIVFTHKQEDKAMQVAHMAKQYLQKYATIGPTSISMRQKKQRVRLVVKARSQQDLKQAIWSVYDYISKQKTYVTMDIDMYPLHFEE